MLGRYLSFIVDVSLANGDINMDATTNAAALFASEIRSFRGHWASFFALRFY